MKRFRFQGKYFGEKKIMVISEKVNYDVTFFYIRQYEATIYTKAWNRFK